MERLLAKGLSTASLAMSKASACTLCESDQGQEVRAGVLDGGFGATLLEVMLPLAVAVGLAALACAVAPERAKPRAAPRNPYGAHDVAG